MKKKIIYILAVVCCMSFFSSAKQNGRKCPSAKVEIKPKPQAVQKTEIDLSHLSLFLFDL